MTRSLSEILQILRKERGWLLRVKGSDLEMIRTFNGRPVTLLLESQGGGRYHLVFPSYIFHSTISHFAPSEEEHRFCRNKNLLASVVKVLKRSALWDRLENKDFMVVNTANNRSNKAKLRSELEFLRSYRPRKGQ